MNVHSSPSSKSSRPTWLLVLVVALGASGCQWVFGDFEFRADDGSGGAGAGGADGNGGAATGGANPNACSPDGFRRCDGAQPQVCKVDVWTNDGSPCSPASLCNLSKGVCDVCFGGTKRCGTNNKTIETCNGSGESWDVTVTCSGTSFCDPGKLTNCVVCRLGETNCVDATTAKTCKGDQTGFESLSCQGLPCVAKGGGNDYCAKCTPGVSLATCTTAGALLTCNNDQLFTETGCPNGCMGATATTAGYCKP